MFDVLVGRGEGGGVPWDGLTRSGATSGHIERGVWTMTQSEATEGTIQCTCVYLSLSFKNPFTPPPLQISNQHPWPSPWERSGGLHISLIFGDGEGKWGVGVNGDGGGSLTIE